MNRSSVLSGGGDRRGPVWQRASRSIALPGAATVLLVLSGCSGLGIGGSEYGCPGMPAGIHCLPAREVYAATHDGGLARAAPTRPRGDTVALSATRAAAPPGPRTGMPARLFSAALFTVRPEDRTVPLRAPARVMRIWIAPWEDRDGDLVLSGYRYTEIEPRRWVIGTGPPRDEPVLHPLAKEKPEMTSATNEQENAS